MSTEVNKAAAWTCVEIAARDLSSLPGQSQLRGIGGYTSCSDEFLIEASSWGDLLESLRSRGFPVSREL